MGNQMGIRRTMMTVGELLRLPQFFIFAFLMLFSNGCKESLQQCDEAALISWQPYDSLTLYDCRSVSLSERFLICLKSKDSLIFYDIVLLKKQGTISINQDIMGIVTHISISPDNSKLLFLSNFKRLYLTDVSGNLLCDFSPWMVEQELELLASSINPIVWIDETTFASHFYSSCYECVDSNFFIGVFQFNPDNCSIRISKYLVKKEKTTNIPWKLYASHPTPTYLVHGDTLLITFSFLPYLFMYNIKSDDVKDSLYINSQLFQYPETFRMGRFREFSKYRQYLHTYKLRNSWIGQPIILDDSILGTSILTKVPDDLISLGVRPLSLWIRLNSKTYDVVFNTNELITRILGGYDNMLVTASHTGKLYLFKFTWDYLSCVDSFKAKEHIWKKLSQLKLGIEKDLSSFLMKQAQHLKDGYLIWLPSGCKSDLLMIPDQLATSNVKFLLNDPALAQLLPDSALTEVIPSQIKQILNYKFPSITAFKVKNHVIQDTLNGFKILESLSQRQL